VGLPASAGALSGASPGNSGLTTTSALPCQKQQSCPRPSSATARPSNSTQRNDRAYGNLGTALKLRQLDDAIRRLPQGHDLDPKFANSHISSRFALMIKEVGEVLPAVAKASPISTRKSATARKNLGIGLGAEGLGLVDRPDP